MNSGRKWHQNPVLFDALVAAGVLAVLAEDLLTPPGRAEWLLYIVIVLIAARVYTPAKLVALSLACSLFIILGYVSSPAGGIAPLIAVENRLGATGVLWLTTLLLVKLRHSAEALGITKAELGEKARQSDELSRDKERLITEMEARRMLEQQRSDLYSMITHDLKSPLNAIIGYMDMLLDDSPDRIDAETRDIVEAVRRSAGRMNGIIEAFLDVSRLESGSAVLDRMPEDVRALIGDVVSGSMPVAKKKGTLLEAATEDGLPSVIMDRRYVERALTNLVSNALSYTPDGGSVTVRGFVKSGDDGPFLAIEVRDTGKGIPADEQARVFEKYYRSKNSQSGRGSGLGLFIVKGVAEAHGGRVELESEVGRGSTFRMLLPLSG